MTIYYGTGLVWDKERHCILCKFIDGKIETDDGRTIAILDSLGFKREGKSNIIIIEDESEIIDVEEVKEGVIASRIAAHAADVARGIYGAVDWDNMMSKARSELNWKKMLMLSINPELARDIRERCTDTDEEVCSMCGRFCSIKTSKSAINES